MPNVTPFWNTPEERDAYFMGFALESARLAYAAGEVPVGAVVVCNDVVVATGFNQPIGLHDATAHAEMQALRAAGLQLNNYRLPECELFVTLEPCLMCAGAMMHARIRRVVFGAHDYKTGVAGSVMNVFQNEQVNHHTDSMGGVLAEEARAVLQLFFRERRAAKKSLNDRVDSSLG